MAKAIVHYYFSTHHKRKPYRVEIRVDAGELSCTLDVHGRFENQRKASETARNIACLFDSYKEEWGRIVVEDTPPDIRTID